MGLWNSRKDPTKSRTNKGRLLGNQHNESFSPENTDGRGCEAIFSSGRLGPNRKNKKMKSEEELKEPVKFYQWVFRMVLLMEMTLFLIQKVFPVTKFKLCWIKHVVWEGSQSSRTWQSMVAALTNKMFSTMYKAHLRAAGKSGLLAWTGSLLPPVATGNKINPPAAVVPTGSHHNSSDLWSQPLMLYLDAKVTIVPSRCQKLPPSQSLSCLRYYCYVQTKKKPLV